MATVLRSLDLNYPAVYPEHRDTVIVLPEDAEIVGVYSNRMDKPYLRVRYRKSRSQGILQRTFRVYIAVQEQELDLHPDKFKHIGWFQSGGLEYEVIEL